MHIPDSLIVLEVMGTTLAKATPAITSTVPRLSTTLPPVQAVSGATLLNRPMLYVVKISYATDDIADAATFYTDVLQVSPRFQTTFFPFDLIFPHTQLSYRGKPHKYWCHNLVPTDLSCCITQLSYCKTSYQYSCSNLVPTDLTCCIIEVLVRTKCATF